MGALTCLWLGLALETGATNKSSSWREELEVVVGKCAKFAEIKAKAGRDAAQASMLSAREAIQDFLFEDGEPRILWYSDKLFREVVETLSFTGPPFVGANDFIRECYAMGMRELRLAWGLLAEWKAKQPSCLNDMSHINEYEGRCFTTQIDVSLNHFQWAGEFAELERGFNAAKSIYPDLRWENPMMHPRSTFVDVRQHPVWTKADDKSLEHVINILERNQPVFKQNLQALKAAGLFSPAYNALVNEGLWDKLSLYSSLDGWNLGFCATAPHICESFRNQLPGMKKRLPLAVSNQEEVVLFYGSPKSHLLPHNGGCNGRINVHIGLEGFEGSFMRIWTGINSFEDLHWSDNKAIAYNDGAQHEVINGPHHRYVLGIGMMHPDIEEAHFAEAFNRKTRVSIIPERRSARFKQAYKEKRGKMYMPPPKRAPNPAEKDSGRFGTWSFKLSGSRYTADWGSISAYGYVDEAFSITEGGECPWDDFPQLYLTGSRSGSVETLGCKDQEITIYSRRFEPWMENSSVLSSGSGIVDDHKGHQQEL